MKKIISKESFIKIAVSIWAFSIFVGSSASLAFADTLSDRINDVTASQDETSFVNAILGLSVPVAVLCLLGLGIYSGYTLLTSQGNPEKINEAREAITNAVLGFALIGLSVAVLLLIQDVLQIPGVTP